MNKEETGKTFCSLEETVKSVYGEQVSIVRADRVYGGDINDAYRLTLSSGDCIFVKTNSIGNAGFFRAEANGLEALRETGTIGIPQILGMGTDKQRRVSFLALEYIESAPRTGSYWETFGRELAMMHRAKCVPVIRPGEQEGKYGFSEDNYIGASPQKNRPGQKWADFYRECRLLPQITMAQRYLDLSLRKQADWLLEHLDSYLREPEFPSLLHGDLWGGNVLCGSDGKAWLIDPAVYVGDFEADLAMTRLFGSLPDAFYRAYHEVNPVDRKGYSERRGLYDLYHLLNHLNLFGSGYLGSVAEIIRRYAGRR